MKTSFWKAKKVLVTGHTGFKGSWLSLWLQSLGANVVGYALEPPTQPSLFEIARVADGIVPQLRAVPRVDEERRLDIACLSNLMRRKPC